MKGSTTEHCEHLAEDLPAMILSFLFFILDYSRPRCLFVPLDHDEQDGLAMRSGARAWSPTIITAADLEVQARLPIQYQQLVQDSASNGTLCCSMDSPSLKNRMSRISLRRCNNC